MGDTQPTEVSSAQSVSHAVSHQLFNELQELHQQNTELQAQLQNPQAGHTVLQAVTPTFSTQQAARPRMRLPDLSKFDGDRRKCKA